MGVKSYQRHSKRVTHTRRWEAVRQMAKRRDGFRCVGKLPDGRACGARGRLEVDHIRPVRTHPDLSFDLSNLQTLCSACHTRKTRIECGHAPLNPERRAWRDLLHDGDLKCLNP